VGGQVYSQPPLPADLQFLMWGKGEKCPANSLRALPRHYCCALPMHHFTQLNPAIATPNSTFLNNASPLLYFSLTKQDQSTRCFALPKHDRTPPDYAHRYHTLTGLRISIPRQCITLPILDYALRHRCTAEPDASELCCTKPLHHNTARNKSSLYQTVTPQDIRLLHHAIPQQHFAILNDTAPLLHKTLDCSTTQFLNCTLLHFAAPLLHPALLCGSVPYRRCSVLYPTNTSL